MLNRMVCVLFVCFQVGTCVQPFFLLAFSLSFCCVSSLTAGKGTWVQEVITRGIQRHHPHKSYPPREHELESNITTSGDDCCTISFIVLLSVVHYLSICCALPSLVLVFVSLIPRDGQKSPLGGWPSLTCLSVCMERTANISGWRVRQTGCTRHGQRETQFFCLKGKQEGHTWLPDCARNQWTSCNKPPHADGRLGELHKQVQEAFPPTHNKFLSHTHANIVFASTTSFICPCC